MRDRPYGEHSGDGVNASVPPMVDAEASRMIVRAT